MITCEDGNYTPQLDEDGNPIVVVEVVMRASLPLYHLPLMALLVVLMFSINPMIYILDQLQEHMPSYWNNR
jgi:hypothetical protein